MTTSLWRLSAPILAGVLAIMLQGCSHGPPQIDLTGAVTLDGKSVGKGHMRFEPSDAKGTTQEVFLEEGRFSAKLLAGSYKVQIYAPKSSGKKSKRPAGPGEDAEETEESIPSKYNVNTELVIEVSPAKKSHDFELKSK